MGVKKDIAVRSINLTTSKRFPMWHFDQSKLSVRFQQLGFKRQARILKSYTWNEFQCNRGTNDHVSGVSKWLSEKESGMMKMVIFYSSDAAHVAVINGVHCFYRQTSFSRQLKYDTFRKEVGLKGRVLKSARNLKKWTTSANKKKLYKVCEPSHHNTLGFDFFFFFLNKQNL